MPEYIHRAVVRAYIRGAFYRDVSDEKLEPYIEPWLGTGGQPAFYRQIAQNGPKYTDEVEDRYGEIGVPVLILWGEQDEWLPVETGEQLHTRIPDSTFETVPDAGHLVQEDAAENVTSRLSAFLNEEM
jgi:pimeloyl-ACP methyl ester carboxylesterase